jgi:hypothetical protein
MPVKKSPINKTVPKEQASNTINEIDQQMNKLQIAHKKNGIIEKVNNEMNKNMNKQDKNMNKQDKNMNITTEDKEKAVIKYINNVLIKDTVKDNYNPIPIKDLYEDFANLTNIKMMLFKFIDIIKRMGITIEKSTIYHIIGYKLK